MTYEVRYGEVSGERGKSFKNETQDNVFFFIGTLEIGRTVIHFLFPWENCLLGFQCFLFLPIFWPRYMNLLLHCFLFSFIGPFRLEDMSI